MIAATLRAWPVRRRMVVAVLAVPLAAAYGWISAPMTTPGWVAMVSACGLLAALVLGSYVPAPGSGHLVVMGCTPCAVMAAATVPASIAVTADAPHTAGAAAFSLALLMYGAAQRLSAVEACPTTAGPTLSAGAETATTTGA